MQPSFNVMLNISAEFHPILFFPFFHSVNYSTVYLNLIMTLQWGKKKKEKAFQQSSESYFYSTCQDYVAFQSMKVVLFISHFSLLIFVKGSALSTIRV